MLIMFISYLNKSWVIHCKQVTSISEMDLNGLYYKQNIGITSERVHCKVAACAYSFWAGANFRLMFYHEKNIFWCPYFNLVYPYIG
jgi:hypothetical protein